LNGHTDVAIKLIKAGADVHTKDNQGTSPIILSTQFETLDLCCLLLGQGAKINDQEVNQKRTPLIVAASSHPTYEKISFLLMAGADITKKDMYGDTALDIAKAKKADEKVIALLQSRMDEKIKPIQIIRSIDNHEHMAVLYQDQHIKE
jgi:ankyrin repeat protein